MRLSPRDHLALDRELSRRGLAPFLKLGWPILNPADEYIHNWHMDALGEHLEACAEGQINRLLINIPPGTSKSSASSVFFPAWLWGPNAQPHVRFIGASHEAGLATRDSRYTRNIVESDWYQDRWPVSLVPDQNEKTYFETTDRGFRQSSAVESMTGKRGHFVVWDDPHNPKGTDSKTKRDTAVDVFRETLTTRLVSPKKSVIIIIMQRLHKSDVSGYILDNDFGYVHLMLPMEYDRARHCKTSIGFSDPRKKQNELLFEKRFDREVVERDKKVLGAYGTAGQFQQLPAPREGLLIKRDWLPVKPARPAQCTWVRAWDLAGTDDELDNKVAWTRGVLIGRTKDDQYCVGDVVGVRGSPGTVLNLIKSTAVKDGKTVAGSLPQDPGQAGKAQAQAYVRALAGYNYTASPETGDKVTRIKPFAAQAEMGNVFLVKGSWNEEYIDELADFPAGTFADQVDATSRGFSVLTDMPSYNLDGWTT